MLRPSRAAFVVLLTLGTVALAWGGRPLVGGDRPLDPTPVSGALVPSMGDHEKGLDSIQEGDIEVHLWNVASSALEGRDTPSVGQERAGRYIVEEFRRAGVLPATEIPGVASKTGGGRGAGPEEGLADSDYHSTWNRGLPAPVPSGCSLRLIVPGEKPKDFELGEHFVPTDDLNGRAEGSLVFLGYGIRSKSERFDELKGVDLAGTIAVIVEGEPRHKRKFEGPEITAAASLWSKLPELADEGVRGVIVVRRAPDPTDGVKKPPVVLAGPELGYRHTWATWNLQEKGVRRPRGGDRLPVLEVTAEVASELLGDDVLEMAAAIDKAAKPKSREYGKRTVRMAAATETRSLRCTNIVGCIPGSDLAQEIVIVGAHYDHVGVDERGRIGAGADDNGSGTSALLEISSALALAEPRRTVVLCAFSGEEDGLLGSKALADDLPFEKERVVGMVNMDMIGRGETAEVAVLGTRETPVYKDLLEDAKRLAKTGVKNIEFVRGNPDGIWERSDHYSFHRVGIPSIFIFEGVPIGNNKDYHTPRDTIANLDIDKVTRTAKLVYNLVWLMANEDDPMDD